MNDLAPKDNLIKNLEIDIIKYKDYLQYFSLNTENYSRALQIDLEDFSKKIKENEDFLSSFEKNKLIFIKNDSFIDNVKISNINENLLLTKNILENFKLKLISLKKNIQLNNNQYDKIASTSENEINYLFSELKSFKGFKNNPNSSIDDDKSVIL